ncbi:MAG: hypothetical protein WCO19_03895 [Candidatus Saccharibacteria bacterium]
MADANKATIYIDIDDEITSIIDKISQSKQRIVALVLPKRAAMLQSIVNMKLLARAGNEHKKQLVLITSEASILPLAGAVKLHVAKTLQSKPTIPAGPKVPGEELDVDDDSLATGSKESQETIEDDSDIEDVEDAIPASPKSAPLDTSKSVGELAGAAPKAMAEETIDLEDDIEDATADDGSDGTSKKSKNDKKLSIPNFDKFRKKLLIGGGVFVLLLVGWYVGGFVLPTATVTVKTDNISVDTDISFTASAGAKALDADKKIVPAILKEVKKTDVEKITATGQKNVGEKATGTVTIKLSNCATSDVDIPSGSTVSNGSLNFKTQSDISLVSFSKPNKCINDSLPQFTSATVKVAAQDPGDQFNISGGRAFTVSGISNVSGVDSSVMSGGTNKNVTVVSDQDVANAKQKLNDKSKDTATTELKKLLTDAGQFILPDSFAKADPVITATPAVGTESADVSVTSVAAYSMLGVKREDLKTLVVTAAKKQFDATKQSVNDDGLDKAIFRAGDKKSSSEQAFSVQSTVSTGAAIDQDAIKKEIAGKKKGDVQQILGNRPGVKEVSVKYSPFWVYVTPSKPSKITLVFEQVSTGDK